MHNKTHIALALVGAFSTGAVAEVSEIPHGGNLTVPIINTGFVENYNPYTAGGLFDGVLYEPLMFFNNMTGKMEYRLAQSAEYSKDLTQITIRLKPDLHWSDGSPLTAQDVAFSYQLTKDVPAFDVKAIWSSGQLNSVEAMDDSRVVFKLNRPDSTFLWSLAKYHIVPKAVWQTIPTKDLPTFTNPDPVGSGPLTNIKFIKPQQMQICRNEHYYLPNRPYIDCITYRSYNDNSQVQPALMKGELDWGSNFIADVDRTYVSLDPKHHHYWYPANDAIHLYVNTKRKPFDDVRVRQALSMALNREEIVDIAAYGYPTVNHHAGGIGEFYQQYIDTNISEKYRYLTEYHPDKANQLLDEAGYKDLDGDGFRDLPNGETIAFDIDVVNGWTDWIQVVQMVSEYYQEIGIKANIKTVDWSVYDRSLKEGDYAMSINWSLIGSNPIEAYQAYYARSQIGKSWHAGHGINGEQFDKLFHDFGLTNDQEKQAVILSQLQTMTAEQLPFIPLFSNPTWFQYSTKTFVGWPNADDAYVQPSFYDGGNRNLIINHLHLKQ
ncbi:MULTISPECIES: ABC transporter substrate-binding protein [unclassified Vibrio]|uniref:ABC transporter substrate-binding protein n=1 Tax=Vibrio sp. HB236076 TaxID=3232307 RepID=A0AB39HII9_9VIBR|nr:ABC transporter substrate-binding protein [Vibrio sp. HB161653]MDP5252720.1 ABC transporter substrate-binding protein [Vibrio sp. HB161653]